MITVYEKSTNFCGEIFVCTGAPSEEEQSYYQHIYDGEDIGIYKLNHEKVITEKIFPFVISEFTWHRDGKPFDLEHALVQIRFVSPDSVIKNKRKMTLRELCNRLCDVEDSIKLYRALSAILTYLIQGEH